MIYLLICYECPEFTSNLTFTYEYFCVNYLIYVVSDIPVCAVLNCGNGEYKLNRWKSENYKIMLCWCSHSTKHSLT